MRKQIKKTIPFITAMKRIKHLGINLYKEITIENYRTLMKENTNRWRNMPCSWFGRLGRINIVKTSILPKVIFRFSAVPVRLPTVFFTDLEQIISQFV